MTRMTLIAPPSLLRMLPRRNNHLLLPDLMKDEDYASYYQNTRFPGRIILDNGAFEGLPWEKGKLLNIAFDVGATHVVLPDDTTGSDPDPLGTFLRHFEVWPRNFRYIYVIHGRTPSILADRAMEVIAFRREHPDLDFDISISSLALRHVPQGSICYPMDRNYVRPRALMELVERYRRAYGDESPPKLGWIHLLGAVSFEEIKNCVSILSGVATEVTFDTCDPVKEATTWSTKAPYDLNDPTAVRMRLGASVRKWDAI